MSSHLRFRTAAFGPDTLKAMTTAFDAAWLEIVFTIEEDSGQIERARLRLAFTILSIADYGISDSEVLKRWALEIMDIVPRKSSNGKTLGG